MYESHFQLDRRPFAATPDPGCCYLSPTQAPLFRTVEQCVENGQGIAILTGPAGIGKTLLVQVLLAEASERFTGVYLGTGQFPTRRALLQAILYELGQPYGGMTDQELRLELNTTLRNLITQRDGLLLILDEAHLLSDRLLEEVRMVADLAQQGVPLTRVVLSGNPEFEERLTSSTLAAFNQRVACHVALETLTQQESIAYLEHRIRWAGGNVERLFSHAALQLIAYASDGIPRCLNQLADHALLRAFHAGISMVTESLVREALAEVQHLSLRWNPSALHVRSRQTDTCDSIPESIGSMSTALLPREDELIAPPASDEVMEFESANEPESSCIEFGAGDAKSPVEPPASRQAACSEDVAIISTRDESEEDGPPLFAWLAKSSDPVAMFKEDDFSSSSFKIPSRGRTRSIAAEQEIVSTAPLTGSELGAKRGKRIARLVEMCKPPEMPVHDELPAEEVIVDPYARLDARLAPSFPRPTTSFPAVERHSIKVADAGSIRHVADAASVGADCIPPIADTQADDLTEIIQQAIRPGSPDSSPLERLDAICTLLDETEFALGGAGVELVTDFGIERIDIDLPAQVDQQIETANDPRMQPELFDWAGSMVIEVGRDPQQKVVPPATKPMDRTPINPVDELPLGIQRIAKYDIVEPDPIETQATPRLDDGHQSMGISGTASGVVPAPNHGYKNFFSALRRRK